MKRSKHREKEKVNEDFLVKETTGERPGEEENQEAWGEGLAVAIHVLLPLAIAGVLWGRKIILSKILQHLDKACLSVFWPSFSKREKVLKWTMTHLPYLEGGLDTIWTDGSQLCTLINSVVPGACPNPHRHWKKPPTHGQALAYKYLGVIPVFTESDFNQKTITSAIEKTLTEYMTGVQQAVSKISHDEELTFSNNYIARGMGLVTGEQYRKTVLYIYPNSKSKQSDNLLINIRGPYNSHGVSVLYGSDLVELYKTMRTSKREKLEEEEEENRSFLKSLTSDFQSLIKLKQNREPSCDIEISIEIEKNRAKIMFIPRNSGVYEVCLTTNGEHIAGSPYNINVEKNRSGIMDDLSEDESKGKSKKRVIPKIIETGPDSKYVYVKYEEKERWRRQRKVSDFRNSSDSSYNTSVEEDVCYLTIKNEDLNNNNDEKVNNLNVGENEALLQVEVPMKQALMSELNKLKFPHVTDHVEIKTDETVTTIKSQEIRDRIAALGLENAKIVTSKSQEMKDRIAKLEGQIVDRFEEKCANNNDKGKSSGEVQREKWDASSVNNINNNNQSKSSGGVKRTERCIEDALQMREDEANAEATDDDTESPKKILDCSSAQLKTASDKNCVGGELKIAIVGKIGSVSEASKKINVFQKIIDSNKTEIKFNAGHSSAKTETSPKCINANDSPLPRSSSGDENSSPKNDDFSRNFKSSPHQNSKNFNHDYSVKSDDTVHKSSIKSSGDENSSSKNDDFNRHTSPNQNLKNFNRDYSVKTDDTVHKSSIKSSADENSSSKTDDFNRHTSPNQNLKKCNRDYSAKTDDTVHKSSIKSSGDENSSSKNDDFNRHTSPNQNLKNFNRDYSAKTEDTVHKSSIKSSGDENSSSKTDDFNRHTSPNQNLKNFNRDYSAKTEDTAHKSSIKKQHSIHDSTKNDNLIDDPKLLMKNESSMKKNDVDNDSSVKGDDSKSSTTKSPMLLMKNESSMKKDDIDNDSSVKGNDPNLKPSKSSTTKSPIKNADLLLETRKINHDLLRDIKSLKKIYDTSEGADDSICDSSSSIRKNYLITNSKSSIKNDNPNNTVDSGRSTSGENLNELKTTTDVQNCLDSTGNAKLKTSASKNLNRLKITTDVQNCLDSTGNAKLKTSASKNLNHSKTTTDVQNCLDSTGNAKLKTSASNDVKDSGDACVNIGGSRKITHEASSPDHEKTLAITTVYQKPMTEMTETGEFQNPAVAGRKDVSLENLTSAEKRIQRVSNIAKPSIIRRGKGLRLNILRAKDDADANLQGSDKEDSQFESKALDKSTKLESFKKSTPDNFSLQTTPKDVTAPNKESTFSVYEKRSAFEKEMTTKNADSSSALNTTKKTISTISADSAKNSSDLTNINSRSDNGTTSRLAKDSSVTSSINDSNEKTSPRNDSGCRTTNTNPTIKEPASPVSLPDTETEVLPRNPQTVSDVFPRENIKETSATGKGKLHKWKTVDEPEIPALHVTQVDCKTDDENLDLRLSFVKRKEFWHKITSSASTSLNSSCVSLNFDDHHRRYNSLSRLQVKRPKLEARHSLREMRAINPQQFRSLDFIDKRRIHRSDSFALRDRYGSLDDLSFPSVKERRGLFLKEFTQAEAKLVCSARQLKPVTRELIHKLEEKATPKGTRSHEVLQERKAKNLFGSIHDKIKLFDGGFNPGKKRTIKPHESKENVALKENWEHKLNQLPENGTIKTKIKERFEKAHMFFKTLENVKQHRHDQHLKSSLMRRHSLGSNTVKLEMIQTGGSLRNLSVSEMLPLNTLCKDRGSSVSLFSSFSSNGDGKLDYEEVKKLQVNLFLLNNNRKKERKSIHNVFN